MAETTPTPAPVTTTPNKNADQDQVIANDIGGTLLLMDGIANNAEIAAVMLKKGYDTTKLAEGRTLQSAAQTAFEARQSALGLKETAVNALETADKGARDRYADFRGTSRASFTGQADRTALNLNGNVFKDRQKFITQAQTSYNIAKTAAYATQMATDGYDGITLQAALDELIALGQADVAQNLASGGAATATAQRNTAYKALMVYVKRLRGIARVALKKRPDLLGAIGTVDVKMRRGLRPMALS